VAGQSPPTNLGDGKERAPIVGEAVEGGWRQYGIRCGQSVEIIDGPSGRVCWRGFCFEVGVVLVKAGGDLSGLGGNERNEDGSVVEGGREGADAGQGSRGEGVEGANGVPGTLAAVGAGATFVAGVEEAAQFVGLVEVGVHFIEKEGGRLLVHDAEQDGGAHVFGAKWPGDQGGEDIEGGGFATTALGGIEVEARRLVESAEGVGMGAPEGEGISGARGQDDIVGEASGDLVQECRGVEHGFGPGFSDGKGGRR